MRRVLRVAGLIVLSPIGSPRALVKRHRDVNTQHLCSGDIPAVSVA
jgi:hypothetical protein